jgi:hypothetical protein
LFHAEEATTMATYAGRDSARCWRVEWWSQRIGHRRLAELTDDHVHAELEPLAREPSRSYAGRDAEGRPIYRARSGPLSPATQLKALQPHWLLMPLLRRPP